MNTLTGIWVTGAVVSSLVVETIDHTTHHVDNCTRGYSHNSGGQPFASPDGTTNVDGTRILTEKYSRILPRGIPGTTSNILEPASGNTSQLG